LGRRRGGGGRRDPCNFVTGPITMIIIGILLNIIGLGIFCWLLFTLAIHAFPFFVGTPRGSIRFKQAQVHSTPSSLASSRVVSHSWSDSTPSPSRALPLSASSLGCCWRFPRHACRLRSNPRSCPRWCSLGMVARGVRRVRRHHRRWHRLGARVDADRASSQSGHSAGPSSAAD
jgi:hypothetical protein